VARRLLPAPAAGGEPFYTFPDFGDSQGFLLLVQALLTTDATVANRQINLRIRDKNGNPVADYPSPNFQTASFGINYTWGGSNTPYRDAIVGRESIPMNPVSILGGDTLRIDTLAIAAGDVWSDWLISLIGAPEDIRES